MNVLLFSTASRRFSISEKLYILGELAEGLLTDDQAIEKYQLSPKLLRSWRKWRYQRILKKYNPRTVNKPKKSPAEQLKELERRNRELQKELEYKKLRADALDKLIEVGERELNISSRKTGHDNVEEGNALSLSLPSFSVVTFKTTH